MNSATSGERRLTEFELDGFPGFEGSTPVRVGNTASEQFQLDYYGSEELVASVLTIPFVGLLPGTDARVSGTIDAITRELGREGFVSRYSTAQTDDGLPGDEGQFLACSFWLVSALALNGRTDQARALFERLTARSNDLGLLAEEYVVGRRRLVGDFPQAFSYLTLIGVAYAIAIAIADAEADAHGAQATVDTTSRHGDVTGCETWPP